MSLAVRKVINNAGAYCFLISNHHRSISYLSKPVRRSGFELSVICWIEQNLQSMELFVKYSIRHGFYLHNERHMLFIKL